jgi:peptidoglycan/LPS O-acetylase OafA/YrhL
VKSRTRALSYRRLDLDGLRGIAVLLTLLLHYVSRSGAFNLPGSEPLTLLLDSFWSGVDIFFVLSGFLIGRIILAEGGADNFIQIFFIRRALRILPVAYLTMVFSYTVIPLLNPSALWYVGTPPHAYLLFVNNFWTASGHTAYSPLGPLWSLAIEQQFYLLAPALLLWSRPVARNATLVLIVLISPLLRSGDLGFSAWDFTPFRLDGFATGILSAALIRDARFVKWAATNPTTISWLSSGLVAAALLFSCSPQYCAAQRLAWGISLNSLAAGGIIIFLHTRTGSLLSAALSRPWLVLMGRYSYFIYLMHLPILVYVLTAWVRGPSLGAIALAFGITLFGAWGSWRFMESRLIGVGRKIPYTFASVARGDALPSN